MAGGVFGGRGAAPFLVKATTIFAIIFMITSLSLNYVGTGTSTESVFERVGAPATTQSAPAVTDQMPVTAPTLPADAAQTPDAGAAVPGAGEAGTGQSNQ
jgi:preprotein translocase subunit SecG